MNCFENSINKKISDSCGCKYPKECGQTVVLSPECKLALKINSTFRFRLQCRIECPSECNTVSYGINRIDVVYNPKSEEKKENNKLISKKFNITGIPDYDLYKRTTNLYIYFRRLETTEITQSPIMPGTDLIANVGGLLGKKIFNIYFKK